MTTEKKTILNNRYFLYATEFFSGMSVMAVELGASRLLAPYFSSSQIVWTVIIGAIMLAMALGNVWGGRAADKNPDPGKLYFRLLIAAVWIGLIPFVGKYIIAGISLLIASFVSHNFLVWASLASCLVLFVFPLMLLGTVTPSLVKYTVQDLENNGAVVGRLGALNTIGSIIGTFLPTFVTIPAFGTAATFLIFAAVLLLLSVLYFVTAKRRVIACGAAAAVLIVSSFFSADYSFAFWANNLVYEDESIYNYLQVQDNPDSVVLSTNVLAGVQSMMRKDGQLTGMYYDYALAAPLMSGKADEAEVLVLGMGTGTYATMCTRYFPGIKAEGVEIDEKIAALAREYFELPEEVKVTVADGRAFLQGAGKYDVILVDAYQDITIPFQMSSREFFTEVKEHLTENGVMVVNMNMRSGKEGAINDYLADTVASVFPDVVQIPTANGFNIELFACTDGKMLERLDEALRNGQPEDGQLNRMMQQVASGLEPVRGGSLILTDDKAPVEVLGMQVIDEIIGEELEYYREIIRSGNWKELLQ